MYLELSYRLSTDTPRALGVPAVEFEHYYNMDKGDASNLFYLRFSNHTGTHIDAPWHFVSSGFKISDFELQDFVFERPITLELPLGDDALICASHFEDHSHRIANADLLLIKTGYCQVRKREPQRYSVHSPGFSIDGARYLAKNAPQLRAIGLDTISLACMQHLEEGLEAHRILLAGAARRFLIIEDMNLDCNLSNLQRVIALPLFLENVDSSPCTVMGII